MRILLLATLLLAAAVPQARADEAAGNPVETLREGMTKAVEALRNLAEEVQRYGVPYFDKDGNIVIPRQQDKADRPSVGKSPADDSVSL